MGDANSGITRISEAGEGKTLSDTGTDGDTGCIDVFALGLLV